MAMAAVSNLLDVDSDHDFEDFEQFVAAKVSLVFVVYQIEQEANLKAEHFAVNARVTRGEFKKKKKKKLA
jgi:hypothetical protein